MVTVLADMDEDEALVGEDRNLRFLRRLVTVLTATMILGVLTIVVLLVIRLNGLGAVLPLPDLPSAVVLPGGVEARSLTFGPGWVGIVTSDSRFLIYDSESGALADSVEITLPE
ncbi:MAG: DUF6476 family protein [Paracoccaceae bacterium]|nr:DUF6476 family protein [Paracoccaceae bacterium]